MLRQTNNNPETKNSGFLHSTEVRKMTVTRKSMFSGDLRSWYLPITPDQYSRISRRFETGELVKDIVPHLSKEERDFLISGATPLEMVDLEQATI